MGGNLLLNDSSNRRRRRDRKGRVEGNANKERMNGRMKEKERAACWEQGPRGWARVNYFITAPP